METLNIFNNAIKTLNNGNVSFPNREFKINGKTFRNCTNLGKTEYSVFFTREANNIKGWRSYEKIFKNKESFDKYLLNECKK